MNKTTFKDLNHKKISNIFLIYMMLDKYLLFITKMFT